MPHTHLPSPNNFSDPNWWVNRTAADVETARAALEKRVARLTVGVWASALLLVALVTTALMPLMFDLLFGMKGLEPALGWAWVGATIDLSVLLVTARKLTAQGINLAGLLPLQSQATCQLVLDQVRDHESVRAYRDRVVANGRSILQVDQWCMQELARASARQMDAARLQQWRLKVEGKAGEGGEYCDPAGAGVSAAAA